MHPTQSSKNQRKGYFASFGWLLAAFMLASSFNAAAAQSNKSSSKRSGKEIFHDYCSVCHGDKGDGQSRARNSFLVPPRDYTTPEAAIELTRDRMIHSVTNGRPGTAMIAWRTALSKQEIAEVVDYIRSTFMKLGGNVTKRTPPSEKLLSTRGGKLYMQSCVMCHGETGARQTTGRMQPPPRDFTSPAVITELTRDRMIASITNGRPGSAMRPYGGQLSQADIEAIVDFIRAAYMSTSK